MKTSALLTELQPHQQRLIDKMRASGGLLVAHGMGSGKTLSSIAVADALGLTPDVVAPAALQANYEKEMIKHLGARPEGTRVRSYEKAVRDGDINANGLVIMDEAHRARNTGTAVSDTIARQAGNAKARMLLTGTPVYNQPSDIANLLNTAAGRELLPSDPAQFRKMFVGEQEVKAPIWDRIRGGIFGHNVNSMVPVLKNRQRLIDAATGYVDVHKGGVGEYFPERIDESHDVPMSNSQWDAYRFHEGQMPWYLQAKVRSGLPLNKQESKDLNAFQGALRQVANTPRPYMANMTDEEEVAQAPKIQKMVEHIQKMRAENPNHRGVMYSNFLEAGLNPLSRSLTQAGIAHNVFTGDISKAQRDQMVLDYNSGKNPLLLLSGAGAEGLDLQGTRSIQLMEPHWNDARIDQVIGRGIRFKSHDALPADQRNVKVMKYQSTIPKGTFDGFKEKVLGMKPVQGIEQHLKSTSDYKNQIGNQIRDALQEASDRGPLRGPPKFASFRELGALSCAKALGF